MTPQTECLHEREVLDLVLADRWPDRCDEDIRAHAAQCESCTEVIAVAMAMRDSDADVARRDAPAGALDAVRSGSPHSRPVVSHDLGLRGAHPLPDATLVWWRAQLRAHEDAGRRAARPIAMAQGIGLGIGLVGVLSAFRMFWPSVVSGAGYASDVLVSALQRAGQTSTTAAMAAPWLTFAVIVTIVAGPVALYFALGKD